jgi:hypothetical protein
MCVKRKGAWLWGLLLSPSCGVLPSRSWVCRAPVPQYKPTVNTRQLLHGACAGLVRCALLCVVRGRGQGPGPGASHQGPATRGQCMCVLCVNCGL